MLRGIDAYDGNLTHTLTSQFGVDNLAVELSSKIARRADQVRLRFFRDVTVIGIAQSKVSLCPREDSVLL
jgi:hypothetical protein